MPSHVQGTVLEPCPRLDVQLNKSMDPLGRAVAGTESTSDVVCRLFGTTIIGVRDGGQGGQLPPQFGQFVDMNSGRESTLFGQNTIHV